MTVEIVVLVILAAFVFFGILVWFKRLIPKEISRGLADVTKNLESSIGTMARSALADNSEQFLKLADERLRAERSLGLSELQGKKELIDKSLEGVKEELQKVSNLVREFESDRKEKFGQLTEAIRGCVDVTGKLHLTTDQLKSVLANPQRTGQWGERMADDIIRYIGFKKGINYDKQEVQTTNLGRPDYTFYLPQNKKVNMDVKFPLQNYSRHMEADSMLDKDHFKSQFIGDVKRMISSVVTREYINEDTVDYVIVFIPNEQVYSFIHEHDNLLLEEALRKKVILCAPITLYAILAVIRQAVENFNLEKVTDEIVGLLGAFNKQWESFRDTMDKLGKKIDDSRKQFDELHTTRVRSLEKPLRKIEELRQHKGIQIQGDEPGFIEEPRIDSESNGENLPF